MEEERNSFHDHFNLASFLPLLIFLLGIYTIYLFIVGFTTMAFLVMMFSFIVYVANNVCINIFRNASIFNEYLEDSSAFIAFAMTSIVFGFLFYKDIVSLATVFFFAICTLLSMSRNWILHFKNSKGWPLALNGLVFPLIYFIYVFYLKSPGDSIFLVYYVVIGFLAISNYNFLGYKENSSTSYIAKPIEKKEELTEEKKNENASESQNKEELQKPEENTLSSENQQKEEEKKKEGEEKVSFFSKISRLFRKEKKKEEIKKEENKSVEEEQGVVATKKENSEEEFADLSEEGDLKVT
ncbi:hypothetical protein H6501_02035 [Candidatus Woesearchaeota archaeon]|nr:hypothetical protein [Nanoarchaeota archaeon]MCB9370356.1 hypothetical protein [Candidatus Woesearchaeota archaeon]USN44877.1 MAG: hypothetical protein H6500_03480 [Candidatus Woesearchaeota archaeon]